MEDTKSGPEDKKSRLENAIKLIEKNHGKNAVMRLGDKPQEAIEVIDSGSLLLNEALGVWGWPRGRIVEIFGPEMSGKTTLCLHAIAETQKAGGICAFIDAEHALDAEYAKNLGVNVDDLYLSQPENGETALEIADELISTQAVDLLIVDSVAALVPKAELEGNMGDAQMALQARLMSQAMRKLNGVISRTGTCVIFTNQLRMKIGVFFGNPETTTGGNALKFYASVRIDIRRGEAIKKGDDIIGSEPKIKVVKNKVAPPFKACITKILFGKGIDRFWETVTVAVKHDIVHKSGSWFAYNEERIGQGMDNVLEFLKENPDTYKEIEGKVFALLGNPKKAKEVEADTKTKIRKPRKGKTDDNT